MADKNGVAKPKSKRRGRVAAVAGADGEAARFVEGADAVAPEFDPAPVADELGLYWKSGHGDQFLVRDAGGRWTIWPKMAILDRMRMLPGRLIAMKAREGERISEAQRVLLWVRENRCLDEIFPALPGYTAGIHELNAGERVLVRTQWRPVVPAEGEWGTIGKLIDGLLKIPGDVDQAVYFHAWAKIALESMREGEPGNWRAGHALVLTGPAGCGKSRLQENVITALLGSRQADPQKFLFGGDDFNGDVFCAEHLCLGEVPLPSQRTVDRTALAEKIKQVVANGAQRMRLMRTEPWTVYPFWRLTISLNDDPDKLRSLPLITSDFGDKVLIFHCNRVPLPMPTVSLAERKAFTDAMAAEVPGYAWWLLNVFEIPEELKFYPDGRDATRFGFREFHHPIIKGGLWDETPAAELMGLMDMAEFDVDGQRVRLWDLPSWAPVVAGQGGPGYVRGAIWHERAEVLQGLLTGDGGYVCSVSKMAASLFRHSRCSTLLGRLAAEESLELRVQRGNTRHAKGWKIARPAGLAR